MSPAEVLAVAEGLLELDPIGTYGRRAATLIARSVGARGLRLERVGRADILEGRVASTMKMLTFPLRYSRGNVGVLHLYFEQSAPTLETDQRRTLSWFVKILTNAISYAERLRAEDSERPTSVLESPVEESVLTPRERDVVALLVSGASTREIASQTGLAASTVNTYLKRVFMKLGVHSRVELVARLASGLQSDVPDPLSRY